MHEPIINCLPHYESKTDEHWAKVVVGSLHGLLGILKDAALSSKLTYPLSCRVRIDIVCHLLSQSGSRMGIFKCLDFQVDQLSNGQVRYAWHPNRPLLALAGSKGKIFIVSQDSGDILHRFSVPAVQDLRWDNVSEYLGVISEKSGNISIYRHKSKTVELVDTGMKQLTFLRWSATDSTAALGTKNGTIVLYNRLKAKKLPIMGTHTAEVIDGVWTQTKNRLVMVGADRMMTISEVDGTVVASTKLEGDPKGLVLLEMMPGKVTVGKCFAVANIGKGLKAMNVATTDNFAVTFQSEMGTITAISASSTNFIAVGFSTGIVGLAVLNDDTEFVMASHVKAFQGSVIGLAHDGASNLLSAMSDNMIRFFVRRSGDIAEITDIALHIENGDGQLGELHWSGISQECSVAVNNGRFYSYALRLVNVCATCGSLVFVLVSVNLVGVKTLRDDRLLFTIPIDGEPSFMAAGMGTLATGSGNEVFYYEYYIPNIMPPPMHERGEANSTPTKAQSKLIRKVEYGSAVKDIKVSSLYAAVLLDGRIHVHSLHNVDTPASLYPPQDTEAKVITMGLSEPLFFYATSTKMCIITLKNMETVVEYTCRTGVKHAFANPSCTRVAYVDEKNALFLLNPITEVASHAEGFDEDCTTILWDHADPTVFAAHNKVQFSTFVCAPHSRHGAICESVLCSREGGGDGEKDCNLYTPLPDGYRPFNLFGGRIACQTPTGVTSSVLLKSHENIHLRTPNATAFYNNFSLNRLRWCSLNITTPQEAEDLAIKALHLLDIELAIRVYRQLSQPGLVMCLEKIKHIQEKNLLIGHISMIMGYFKDAQNFFLHSSQPLRALEMRRDLMQWEPALNLARDLAPEEVPIISKEYAQWLEYRGEYTKSLEMFKCGQREPPAGHASTELSAARQEVEEHNDLCLQGMTRCYLRTGSIREGMDIALQSKSPAFALECAKLCEEAQRYDEAAQLFEKGGEVERAVTLYIDRCSNLKAAGRLLPQIKSRNIIGMFASAKETEGDYTEAEKAYTQSEDWDNVVRLKVDKLNDLHGAHEIVRKTRSADAAALVAKICQQRNDITTAVEFLVLAQSTLEAYELAKKHNCMFNYQNALINKVVLKDGIAPPQHQKDFALVADYYEKLEKPGQAALFYHIAGYFPQALNKYMEAGEPEDIEKAIEVVGCARSDSLTSKLIDYLMGDTDGQPKEPSYIFKLYMALGSYEKAAKISVFIASKKQDEGNYRIARKVLVDACKILRDRSLRIPNDLRRSLMLVHSYIIVKDLVTMNDNVTATRMLLRVSRNIQKFPAHTTTILTSAVLQSIKTNFKKSAFDLSCILIQNEKHRTELSDKNRKKIEGIVRKRGKEDMEDPVENTSPCPFCDAPVPETELDCGACKNTLLFCVTTGKHIVRSDFAITPCCGFPTLYSAMITRLKDIPCCPVCDAMLDVNKVQRSSEQELKSIQ